PSRDGLGSASLPPIARSRRGVSLGFFAPGMAPIGRSVSWSTSRGERGTPNYRGSVMQGFSPSTIAHSLRWQDAVDVLVLTLLFSRLYAWLKHTVAVQIAFGLFTLVLASWVANHFGLILTSYLLSAVGAVATVVIAIVFQHEIRQGLTRVSALRWLTERRGQHIAGSMATTIAQAAFSLARRGKGALIVIPRRDSVAEHLTAGTAIEGRLSSALIEAIFTSTSSLHDGAIVVGRNRLSRAGVILPLA